MTHSRKQISFSYFTDDYDADHHRRHSHHHHHRIYCYSVYLLIYRMSVHLALAVLTLQTGQGAPFMGINGWKCPHSKSWSNVQIWKWLTSTPGSSCKLKRCPHFGDDITNVYGFSNITLRFLHSIPCILYTSPGQGLVIQEYCIFWGGRGQFPTSVPLSKQQMPDLLPELVSRSMCCMVCEWWL